MCKCPICPLCREPECDCECARCELCERKHDDSFVIVRRYDEILVCEECSESEIYRYCGDCDYACDVEDRCAADVLVDGEVVIICTYCRQRRASMVEAACCEFDELLAIPKLSPVIPVHRDNVPAAAAAKLGARTRALAKVRKRVLDVADWLATNYLPHASYNHDAISTTCKWARDNTGIQFGPNYRLTRRGLLACKGSGKGRDRLIIAFSYTSDVRELVDQLVAAICYASVRST